MNTAGFQFLVILQLFQDPVVTLSTTKFNIQKPTFYLHSVLT